MKRINIILALAAIVASSVCARAEIKFPSVISDNMVLQRNTEAALWGTAKPGAKVSVKTGWSKAKYAVTADKETGKWFVRVSTPEAGGPYDITVSDGKAVTLRNVLIGEVWFASGQSNMEMPVKGYDSQPARGGAQAIIKAKPSRQIRICNIKRCSSPTIVDTTVGNWKEHTPETVANTSATAYFFADALQEVIDIPVGIIVSSWGGSSIETWISEEVIAKEFADEFKLGHLHGEQYNPKSQHQLPALLYNGQVAALVPFTFKGMIWYQGETNRSRPEQYIRLQEAYVRMMREKFCVPDAPFYFVQIAPHKYGNPNHYTSGYFVEAQQKSLDVIPHSGMAVTCDIGEYGTIHPCRKQEVGQRLAMLALKHDYGQDFLEADAPTYKAVKFQDGKANVTFNNARLGLSPMGAEISGFEIAGEDRVFKPAKAMLAKDRKSVDVWSEEVPEPAAVRYCFTNWCEGGLYNNYGIAAAPFRTDDWQL